MGIESTFACNALKDLDLAEKGESIQDVVAVHDVWSIARAASAAPAT